MDNFRAELNLALKNILENNKDKAIEILKNIISKDDKNFISFFYLGNIFSEKQNYELSKKYLNQAISIKPNFPEAYNTLGVVYFNLRKFVEAEQSLNKAIEFNQNNPDPYNNLGLLKREQNDILSAKNFFNKAININDKFFPAYINLMELYERTNQNDLLNEIIKKSEVVFSNNKVIKLYRGKLNYKKKNYSKTIETLQQLNFNDSEIVFEKSRLLNLAKSFDKIGSYEDAFNYFKKMNDISLIDTSLISNRNAYNSNVESRKKYLASLDKIPWVETKLSSHEGPVFMIGFPRSGTTLLDSILRSHPDIEIIEEKPIVEELISKLKHFNCDDLESLNKLTDNDLKELQNIYFEKRKSYLDSNINSKIIIDKLPLNIIYVTEILRVFPNAKLIFSLRHPYDCVLSSYFQNFKLNSSMSNFLKLEDAANFYNIVMEIWTKNKIIFKPDVCELKYEDLVLSFEESIKKVLDFLEIQWSDELYNFNKISKGRRINTPSYYQVTEPINNKAIFRWKNYTNQITNIKPIINYWIDYYKY